MSTLHGEYLERKRQAEAKLRSIHFVTESHRNTLATFQAQLAALPKLIEEEKAHIDRGLAEAERQQRFIDKEFGNPKRGELLRLKDALTRTLRDLRMAKLKEYRQD